MMPGRRRVANGGWEISMWLVVLLLNCHPGLVAAPQTTNASRTIGIEGHVSLDLPRADYQPRPLDDRTEMILRIAAVTPAANGLHHYEFYFMGLEPGSYRLADFVVHPDGSRPDELSNVQFQVRSLLPEDHDGKLTNYMPRPFPFLGGYRVFLGCLAALWAGGIVAFVVSYRKKRVAPQVVPVQPAPTFAERMRPLVEAAAAGRLSLEGKAQLERLMMGFWREKLNLPDQRMADVLARLKNHAQAGALLRALEHWLHQRRGASPEEVAALLEPYREQPAPAPEPGGEP